MGLQPEPGLETRSPGIIHRCSPLDDNSEKGAENVFDKYQLNNNASIG